MLAASDSAELFQVQTYSADSLFYVHTNSVDDHSAKKKRKCGELPRLLHLLVILYIVQHFFTASVFYIDY